MMPQLLTLNQKYPIDQCSLKRKFCSVGVYFECECVYVCLRVLLLSFGLRITQLLFSFLCRLEHLIGFQMHLHSSAPLTRFPLVVFGGTACEVAQHSCLRPLPLHSILSMIEE